MNSKSKEQPTNVYAPHKKQLPIKTGLKVGQMGESYSGCGCSPYDYSEGYMMGYNNALENITKYLSQLEAAL